MGPWDGSHWVVSDVDPIGSFSLGPVQLQSPIPRTLSHACISHQASHASPVSADQHSHDSHAHTMCTHRQHATPVVARDRFRHFTLCACTHLRAQSHCAHERDPPTATISTPPHPLLVSARRAPARTGWRLALVGRRRSGRGSPLFRLVRLTLPISLSKVRSLPSEVRSTPDEVRSGLRAPRPPRAS